LIIHYAHGRKKKVLACEKSKLSGK
jgi:hypothetical protein